MGQKLSVNLSGDLDVRQSSAVCPGGITDVGIGFKFGLLSVNQQADIEISQKLAVIDASGGPVALPFPANLEGRVLYLKVLSGGPLVVTVTHATQGPTAYPVKGLLILEPSDDDRVLGVSVTSGQGSIEWIVTGSEA